MKLKEYLLNEATTLVGFTKKEVGLMESHFKSERWDTAELESPDTFYATNGNTYDEDSWTNIIINIYKERYRKTGETVYRAVRTDESKGSDDEFADEYPAGDWMSKPFGGAESIAELKKLLRKITE